MKALNEMISKVEVTADNAPIIWCDDRIREEKASLLLLDLFLSGNQGKYMNFACSGYSCDPFKKEGKTFNRFEIDLKERDFIRCLYSSQEISQSGEPNFSLYSLLQKESVYHGLDATEHFFGVNSRQAFAPFRLSGRHFSLKPFAEDPFPAPVREDLPYEVAVQSSLCKWYNRRFPNNMNEGGVTGLEVHPSGRILQIFDFKSPCGAVMMKVVKIFCHSGNKLVKCYLPLTRWYWKSMNHNFIATVGLPEKQILMNLPQIAKAGTVVICQTFEDVVALQNGVPDDSDVAFTSFIASLYNQVDFTPLKGKQVKILISNSDAVSLADAYNDANVLYNYLKDDVQGLAGISFIQRQAVFPSYDNVASIEDLLAAHRKQKPYVIEESVQEVSETEFPMMLDKALAEISRKHEQSQDFPFWKTMGENVAASTPRGKERPTDKMILRPYVVGGTSTLIVSAPGMGKSCFATALGARIAGSDVPFIEDRCWTRCTPTGRSGNKVAYLVFDSDGTAGIDEHRRDFAGNIGENDANFIQRNMAGEEIDYSSPSHYNDFVAVLNDIRDNEGHRGQPIDVLFIDTLLAFAHNKTNNAFSLLIKLNKDFPDMAIVVIHHLNLNDKTYGGILTTMGPRVIISLHRTAEQEKDLKGKPTLNDPFTIKIEKFNCNKIPEDGESFEVKLDDQNHFVVVNPVRSQKEMRQLLAKRYGEKYDLSQNEIARLFDTTDRTIRNWLNEEPEK